jgi:hypothetical protein
MRITLPAALCRMVCMSRRREIFRPPRRGQSPMQADRSSYSQRHARFAMLPSSSAGRIATLAQIAFDEMKTAVFLRADPL